MKIAYNLSLKDTNRNVTYVIHTVFDKKITNSENKNLPYFVSIDFINSLSKNSKKC